MAIRLIFFKEIVFLISLKNQPNSSPTAYIQSGEEKPRTKFLLPKSKPNLHLAEVHFAIRVRVTPALSPKRAAMQPASSVPERGPPLRTGRYLACGGEREIFVQIFLKKLAAETGPTVEYNTKVRRRAKNLLYS